MLDAGTSALPSTSLRYTEEVITDKKLAIYIYRQINYMEILRGRSFLECNWPNGIVGTLLLVSYPLYWLTKHLTQQVRHLQSTLKQSNERGRVLCHQTPRKPKSLIQRWGTEYHAVTSAETQSSEASSGQKTKSECLGMAARVVHNQGSISTGKAKTLILMSRTKTGSKKARARGTPWTARTRLEEEGNRAIREVSC